MGTNEFSLVRRKWVAVGVMLIFSIPAPLAHLMDAGPHQVALALGLAVAIWVPLYLQRLDDESESASCDHDEQAPDADDYRQAG